MSNNNWRIKLRLNDKTQKVLPSTGTGTGFTAISAPRGKEEPIYFSPGESDRIINNYGTPGKDNREILEALYYNETYPIYITAPALNGKFGGASINLTGVVAFDEGSLTDNVSDPAIISQGKDLGVGDAVTVTFNETFTSDLGDYNADSLIINVDGVPTDALEFVDTASGQTFSITGGDLDGLAGTIDTDAGTLAVTFPTAPVVGAELTVSWTVLTASMIFIVNSGAQVDDLGVEANYDDTTDLLTIDVLRKAAAGTYSTVIDGPVEVSLDPESIDGFGISNYILNVLDSDFFEVTVADTALEADWSSFVATTVPVDMAGGDRGDTVDGATLAAGYEYAKQTNKYLVDVFFDATANSSIPAVLNTLRDSYHHFSRFLFPLPAVDVDDAKTAFTALSISNRGLSCYWNWGIIRNLYSSSGNVVSSLMGEVAKKHADTIIGGFGGMAPAWIDENGMGGEMSSGRIVEMLYSADEAQLEAMDNARFNPIVQDPVYGILIKSRRTTQLALTDYSFIDYSGAADYILRNVIQQVLPYQLIKFNDTPHRDSVSTRTRNIIAPMTLTPTNVIYDYAVKCDDENNSGDVLDREEFVLSVAVQFTRKSRTIIFNFINTPVSSEIEEAFA